MLRALFPQAAFISKERSLHAAVQLQSAHLHNTIDALIDSGATNNFISPALVLQFRIPIYRLTKSKIVRNVDGTTNSNGVVNEYAPITILYHGQCHRQGTAYCLLGLWPRDDDIKARAALAVVC
jgi:hypothetical protein